ncbi:uncharacterized protein LOC135376574 [Ornithodoros turicata]|uniref:uncharacterized protein LOC135376574 n=1 Tax=Ornithodoros turicata TaxID=34597 RepID=UPI003139DE93
MEHSPPRGHLLRSGARYGLPEQVQPTGPVGDGTAPAGVQPQDTMPRPCRQRTGQPRPPRQETGGRPRPRASPERTSQQQRSAATWIVVHNARPVGWASHTRWAAQVRPLRGTSPSRIPLPFRGLTLTDRHPQDPPIPLTAEEERLLCPVCRVPEVHRSTHLRGALHRSRITAPRTAGSDVDAALATLRRLRPDLLRQGPPPPPPQLEPSPEDIILEMPSDDDL